MRGAREGVLVEREDEIGVLSHAIASVGDGDVVLVEGPAGIGKSTLLEFAAQLASAQGLVVLKARGGELEQEFSFGVVRQLFMRHLARLPASRRVEVLNGAAALALPALELGADGQRSRGDPESVPHGLYWLAAGLAAVRPLLISVDDVQWVDTPSLHWLAYLARRIEGVPIAIVLGLRSSDAATDPDGIAALRTEKTVRGVVPSPLSIDGVATMVGRRFSQRPDPEFLAACHEVTAGNPFLVSELLQTVESEEIPVTRVSADHIRRLAPEAIAHAAVTRLSRLPGDARAVAVATAILEPHAEVRYVTGLTGLSQGTVARAIDALIEANILAPVRPLTFAHPIMQTAVLAELPPAQTAETHKRAARLLSDGHAGPELAATHLGQSEHSGDQWAVEVLIAAGAQAQARGAPQTAVVHLRRGLAEPPDPPQRAAVLLPLGLAEFATQRPAAIDHLREASQIGPTPAIRATAALALAQVLVAVGEASAACQLLETAREDAASDRELGLAIDAYLISAQINGRVPPVLDERLSRLARELPGSTVAERMLLAHIANALQLRNRPLHELLPIVERVLKDGALDLDQPDLFSAGLPATVLMAADELDASDRLVATLLEHARERALLPSFVYASLVRAEIALRAGNLALAQTSVDDAQAASHEHSLDYFMLLATSIEVRLAIESNALAHARARLGKFPIPPQLAGAAITAYLEHARGALALARRDFREASLAFAAAGRVLETCGITNPAIVPWQVGAALAQAGLGNAYEAGRLATDALRLARACECPTPIGNALRGLAVVDPARRLGALREAVTVLRESPARLQRAYALAELGAALRRAGERSVGRENLLEALELARRCGSLRLERFAREELAALGTRPRRAERSGHDALTASENRVARMAAEGMSNAEIAQALFVTSKTVETHLSRTYAKLRISSRRALPSALDSGDSSPP